jgi:hypothetical protein
LRNLLPRHARFVPQQPNTRRPLERERAVPLAVELVRRLEQGQEFVDLECVHLLALDGLPRPSAAGHVPSDPSRVLGFVQDRRKRPERRVDRAVP